MTGLTTHAGPMKQCPNCKHEIPEGWMHTVTNPALGMCSSVPRRTS